MQSNHRAVAGVAILIMALGINLKGIQAQEGVVQPTPGSLYAWGGPNEEGVLDAPAGNDFVAIAAGGLHNVAIRSDGSLIGWGFNGPDGRTDVPAGNDFVAVAAGIAHSLALRSDGSVVGWGSNNAGQTTVPAGTYKAIAAAENYSLAVRMDGTLAGWGDTFYGATQVPSGSDFVAVAAGHFHGIALRSDGSVTVWLATRIYSNLDLFEQYQDLLYPPQGPFVAVSAGGHRNVALRLDGTLADWGAFSQPAVPTGNNFVAIAAGAAHSLALKSDGSLVGWGDNSLGQTEVPVGNGFVAIAAGTEHCLAIGPELDPVALLKRLIDDVDAINLANGIENAADAKLDNALDALLAENADQRQDAANKLNSFINSVEAQRGKEITDTDATHLINSAKRIIDKLLN
ncbi:MAG: hypothetical protein WD872_04515 [Pirellulaceae bacterium]